MIWGMDPRAGDQASWDDLARTLGGSFGIADPEFGHDISFFAFDLPLYR
jgi:uncharacterized membrane protein (UPF0182 family)